MKKELFTFLTMFICTLGMAQISYTSLGNGQYQYNSQLQLSNLHFYLFGDGHHSFEMEPNHKFDEVSNPSQVKVYTSNPYNPDPPDLELLNLVTNGENPGTIPAYNYRKKVELTETWNPVNNRENYYILSFQNIESADPISGCIEFHYDQNDNHVEGVNIEDHYNNNWVQGRQSLPSDYPSKFTNKFKWDFSDLEFGEKRFIYIPADCLALSTDFVSTRAVMKVRNCTSTIPIESVVDGSTPGVDNSPVYTLTLRVSNNPHDPNGIITDPGCLSFPFEEQTVRYKVYFQNDGSDPVINVDIKFLNNKPIQNIQIVEASHTCELTWSPSYSGIATEPIFITFDEILLPGLHQVNPVVKYESTYGWIEFDICYSNEHFKGSQIKCANTEAMIFFDDLDPISAFNEICTIHDNSTITALVPCPYTHYICPSVINPHQEYGVSNRITSTAESGKLKDDKINVYPNPAYDKIKLSNIDLSTVKNVKIINTKGHQVQIINSLLLKEEGSIDISNLLAGVFYIAVTTTETVKTIPFVKL